MCSPLQTKIINSEESTLPIHSAELHVSGENENGVWVPYCHCHLSHIKIKLRKLSNIISEEKEKER